VPSNLKGKTLTARLTYNTAPIQTECKDTTFKVPA
jgi:hypothetical protein